MAEPATSGWRPALGTALMLLTRLPVPRVLQPTTAPDAALLTRSAAFYPLVGAVLGALLWLLAALALTRLPSLAAAALALAGWAYLTGALHLDGLADCIDGLAAGHRDPTRLRAAMQDSRIGALGASALNVALILKWALLTALLEAGAAGALIGICLAARLAALACIQFTPYSPVGGSAAQAQRGGGMVLAWSLGAWLLGGICWGWGTASLAAAAAGAWLWYWRRLWCRTLGGYSGDTLGGLIETMEIVLLGVLCSVW